MVKKIHFYRFTEPFKLTGKRFSEALEKKRCRPCGEMEPFCNGWIEPLGQGGHMLAHETDGNLMICLRREEKADDLTLKQLKFDSALVDEADDQGGDDAAARFDADFALTAPELGQLLPDLLQAVGGKG